MGLLDRRRRRKAEADAEARTLTLSQMLDIAGGRRSSSGIVVTETAAQALGIIHAAAKVVADAGAMLPVGVFAGSGTDRRELPRPQLLVDPGGEGYGWMDWCWSFLYSACIRGDVVTRQLADDRLGYPTILQQQNLDDVDVRFDQTGRVVWRVRNDIVPADRIRHYRRFPKPGPQQVLGMSPIMAMAADVGYALNARAYADKFYGEGGHPDALLSSPNPLTPEVADIAKDRWAANMTGRRGVAVLGGGWSYTPVQVSPSDAQLLELLNLTDVQIARAFGPGMAELLGLKTSDSKTYSNVEQEDLHVLQYVLDPWLTSLENWLTALVPPGQYVKFNRAALVRTDIAARYNAYELAIRAGWMTVNEVRSLEELHPVDWGDEPYLPGMGPAAAAMEEQTAAPVDPAAEQPRFDIHVDATTRIEPDAIKVDARSEHHIDAPTTVAEGAVRNEIQVPVDATTALTEDSIQVRVEPVNVNVTQPARKAVRRNVETDDAGRITAITETEVD